MLDADKFSKATIDSDIDYWNGPVWSCDLAAEQLLPIGAAGDRENIQVFWFGTREHPRPDNDWLGQRFPTAESCIAGFKEAFKEYCDSWCGETARQEILANAGPSERQAFEKHEWLPFTSVGSILINPSAGVICFCCGCEIDYNLDEHGVEICLIDRAWRFGYGADRMDYFEYYTDKEG